ncbi:MAG TPA: PIN domain-containing protein [Chthoniobacterales bacterium]
MNRFIQLDTNALIALADPAGGVVQLVRERVQQGQLPAASAVAWHEFVRGPLLSDELLRVERVVGARVQPVTRGTAELAARLFNATGCRRASTADCFIAASAIESGAELLATNLEDFQPFVPFGLHLTVPA